MIRYLTYENLNDDERFLLLYSKQTPDLENFLKIYEYCILLFYKWNKKYGICVKKKTPFFKNFKILKNGNKNISSFIDYIE